MCKSCTLECVHSNTHTYTLVLYLYTVHITTTHRYLPDLYPSDNHDVDGGDGVDTEHALHTGTSGSHVDTDPDAEVCGATGVHALVRYQVYFRLETCARGVNTGSRVTHSIVKQRYTVYIDHGARTLYDSTLYIVHCT